MQKVFPAIAHTHTHTHTHTQSHLLLVFVPALVGGLTLEFEWQ